MPGKVKVRILSGRNLPVMDRGSDTTDAFCEVKLADTVYKTDVFRKSLNPVWNSDWFRFDVDDLELQDEPLQIRIMDYDTYSANDAIGKVYINLNPLLISHRGLHVVQTPGAATVTGVAAPETTTTVGSSGSAVSMAGWVTRDAAEAAVSGNDALSAAPVPSGVGLSAPVVASAAAVSSTSSSSGSGPSTSSRSSGHLLSGWLPIFDTMHGIRGDVNVQVKVELFSDYNKFRQSSCGVNFFYTPKVPEGFKAQFVNGFVEELVVNDDPEYQWIDKIRTPRASNEARQTLFMKLSGAVQRKIGLKALELGGNAVIGYQQKFDLEGDTGIVVRAIGTAVTLVKVISSSQDPPQVHRVHGTSTASPAADKGDDVDDDDPPKLRQSQSLQMIRDHDRSRAPSGGGAASSKPPAAASKVSDVRQWSREDLHHHHLLISSSSRKLSDTGSCSSASYQQRFRKRSLAQQFMQQVVLKAKSTAIAPLPSSRVAGTNDHHHPGRGGGGVARRVVSFKKVNRSGNKLQAKAGAANLASGVKGLRVGLPYPIQSAAKSNNNNCKSCPSVDLLLNNRPSSSSWSSSLLGRPSSSGSSNMRHLLLSAVAGNVPAKALPPPLDQKNQEMPGPLAGQGCVPSKSESCPKDMGQEAPEDRRESVQSLPVVEVSFSGMPTSSLTSSGGSRGDPSSLLGQSTVGGATSTLEPEKSPNCPIGAEKDDGGPGSHPPPDVAAAPLEPANPEEMAVGRHPGGLGSSRSTSGPSASSSSSMSSSSCSSFSSSSSSPSKSGSGERDIDDDEDRQDAVVKAVFDLSFGSEFSDVEDAVEDDLELDEDEKEVQQTTLANTNLNRNPGLALVVDQPSCKKGPRDDPSPKESSLTQTTSSLAVKEVVVPVIEVPPEAKTKKIQAQTDPGAPDLMKPPANSTSSTSSSCATMNPGSSSNNNHSVDKTSSSSSRRLSDLDGVPSHLLSRGTFGGEKQPKLGGGRPMGVVVGGNPNNECLEFLEYPFITMKKFSPGFVQRFGGLVSCKSVKLLESLEEDSSMRDHWWTEIRREIRSHAKSLGCNLIVGYTEDSIISDEVMVLSASGTAAVSDLSLILDLESAGIFGPPFIPNTAYLPSRIQQDTALGNTHHPSLGIDPPTPTCSMVHLPYNEMALPYTCKVNRCRCCLKGKVPDVLFTTIEPPDGLELSGRGCLVQAKVVRLKKDLKGENNAKEISDSLPFVEYEVHRQLINKLKVKGMNGLFGLRAKLAIGERTIVATVSGTAAHISALPIPSRPRLVMTTNVAAAASSVASSGGGRDKDYLALVQKQLENKMAENLRFYGIICPNKKANNNDPADCPEEGHQPAEDAQLGKASPTLQVQTVGGLARDPEVLQEPDFSAGNKDACVLEIDDSEDADILDSLMDDAPPSDVQVCATETLVGVSPDHVVRCCQTFSHVWRGKIQPSSSREVSAAFQRMMTSILFKMRRLRPCLIFNLDMKADFSEDSELQLTTYGAVIALAEDGKTLSQLELESGSLARIDGGVPSPILRPGQKFYVDHAGRAFAAVVNVTPLSYIPGGRIEKYLGNLNFFLIRETSGLREAGGINLFVQSFTHEVHSMVRAHVRALGGNALVSYFMSELIIMHSPHKNQAQCLIHVGGDVVTASYFAYGPTPCSS